MGLAVGVLQAVFSLPFLLLSSYFFFKLRDKFSMKSMPNLLTITSLMLFENGIMIILRFFVGLKLVLSQGIDHSVDAWQRGSKALYLVNFAIPLFFIFAWAYIRIEIQNRSGSCFGVPVSLVKKFEQHQRQRRLKNEPRQHQGDSFEEDEVSRVQSIEFPSQLGDESRLGGYLNAIEAAHICKADAEAMDAAEDDTGTSLSNGPQYSEI